MPPKKAEKVPRRARARAADRRKPHPATGLKVIGAGLVVLVLGIGWLNAVRRDDTGETAMPYSQGGLTTVAGGDHGGVLPSTRAAVPVPFGPNTLVTTDEGLVTTTTTPEGEVTTTSVLAAASRPTPSWIVQWIAPGTSTTSTSRAPGTTTSRPPHPSTSTTRPTTTTTRPTTTTSSSTTTSTSTTTTSTSTTTTTEPTTSTTEGTTTTEGSTTTSASTTTSGSTTTSR